MAAINAAGYDTDADSPNNSPLRETIRKELAGKQIPSLAALKDFYREHRQADATADLSQYISFALSVDGPPNFEPKGRAVEVPPDAAPLDGFGPLLAKFYDEAGIEELWNQSQPAFEQAIDRYHEPVAEAVLQVNGFLRNETSGTSAALVPDLYRLAGRSQSDPDAQLWTELLRGDHALARAAHPRHPARLSALSARSLCHPPRRARSCARAAWATMRSAPRRSIHRSNRIILLLVTESLIKAIEARLDKQPALVNQAMQEGYILTAYFAEQLQAYLKQEQAMRFYYPQMIEAIDLKREDARLSQIEFVSQAPVPAGKGRRSAPAPGTEGRLQDPGAGRTVLHGSRPGSRPRAFPEGAAGDWR